MRWKARGKNRSVSPRTLHRCDLKTFKTRAHLLSYATRYPGALAANFLNTVRFKAGKGEISETHHLR